MGSDDSIRNATAGLWLLLTLYLVGKEAHSATDGNWWAVVVVCVLWIMGLMMLIASVEGD